MTTNRPVVARASHAAQVQSRVKKLEKIDRIEIPAEEAAIVTYVRQLMRTNRADQAAFDALHKKHGTKWLVELTAGVHYFAMLCGVVNAFEVAAPPDGDKLPA